MAPEVDRALVFTRTKRGAKPCRKARAKWDQSHGDSREQAPERPAAGVGGIPTQTGTSPGKVYGSGVLEGCPYATGLVRLAS